MTTLSIEAETQRHSVAPAIAPAAQSVFVEPLANKVARWVLGIAYACHPKRVSTLPALSLWTTIDLLRGGTRIPDQKRTFASPDTFAGVCRSPTVETLVAAARIGFYPWCHVGLLKWWTHKKRMVLFFQDHRITRRFRSVMRNAGYRVTFDAAFDDVIRACAEPRQNRWHSLTWITPRIMKLYSEMHRAGYAHSVEVWDRDGHLVGGTYGVAVGRIFVTESQFFRQPNASKVGFHVLNHHLAKWGFVLNDNKAWTEATAAMGFREISRAEFEKILSEHAMSGDRCGPWNVEDDVAAVAAACGRCLKET